MRVRTVVIQTPNVWYAIADACDASEPRIVFEVFYNVPVVRIYHGRKHISCLRQLVSSYLNHLKCMYCNTIPLVYMDGTICTSKDKPFPGTSIDVYPACRSNGTMECLIDSLSKFS